MALDTADKRDSAIHVSLPWRMRFPVPDGSLAAPDRLHVGLLYRGIAAGAAAIATIVGQWSNVIDCRSANQRIECYSANKRI